MCFIKKNSKTSMGLLLFALITIIITILDPVGSYYVNVKLLTLYSQHSATVSYHHKSSDWASDCMKAKRE